VGLQRGCGVWGWGADVLGTGAQALRGVGDADAPGHTRRAPAGLAV
jgi:hypothetical protein